MLDEAEDAAASSPTSSTDQQVERAAARRSASTATQAARFGIQPQVIDDTLNDAFGQRQVAQYFTQINSYNVMLEVLPELQERPRDARPAST